MTAAEAKVYGMVDDVLTKTKEVNQDQNGKENDQRQPVQFCGRR